MSFLIGVTFTVALSSCGGGGNAYKAASPPVSFAQASGRTYPVISAGMEPTLRCARPGILCQATYPDHVVVSPVAGPPKRGDIIVVKAPPLARQTCTDARTLIGRVIGLPGETVDESRGRILVDGKPLREPYVTYRETATRGPWYVPKGDYFIVGDDRPNSCDSRDWAGVPSGNIIGRVVEIVRHRSFTAP